MIRRLTILCMAFTFSIGLSQQLQAGILLDKSILNFAANEAPRKDIMITNQGDDVAYVKIEILEVINPGTEQEERNIVNNLGDIQFVVTPAKLAIPPKGRKQVRLVNLAPPGDETIYRINFTPVLAPLAGDEGMGVRVVIAYQVLALIHPENPEENLQVTREGNKVVFTNLGNSYSLISDFEQCDANGENCKDDIAGTRLYSGNTHEIELPYTSSPVNYRVTNFKGARQAIIE